MDPAPPPGAPHSHNGRRGLWGGIVAIAAAVAKFGTAALAFVAKGGLLFLKFFKLGGTSISMLVSVVIFIGLFGPIYGVGLLLLFAVHEVGHMVMAWREGVPVSTPIFLGPFGAFVRHAPPIDARQGAVLAIGGPLLGIAASLLLYAAAVLFAGGRLHFLLLALAYFGCFLNLLNLIPFSPLDGGKIASALSPWANVAGLVLLIPIVLLMGARGFLNPFLLLLMILGIVNIFSQFRNARRGIRVPQLQRRTRVLVALSYFGVAAVAALGMTASHTLLVNGGLAPPANNYLNGSSQ